MRTHHKLEGTPYALTNDPNPCLRAYHMPEGTPYALTNDPNPSLRAYHVPEGSPYVFENHPTPNSKEKEFRNKRKKHSQNNVKDGETKRRNCEDKNKQDKQYKENT